MQPHEERVVTEKQDLDEKLAKLKTFCFGPDRVIFRKLAAVDRDLLEDQYTVMQRYSVILGKRIVRFSGPTMPPGPHTNDVPRPDPGRPGGDDDGG